MPAPSPKVGRAVSWGSLLAAILVGFAIGGLCVYFYLNEYTSKRTTSDTATPKEADASNEGEGTIAALGRIEPKDGVLLLGVATPDRILKMLVNEGQHVNRGEKLVELESETQRELEENAIDIERREAERRLKAVSASGKAQIQVEEVRLQQAKELGPLEIKSQLGKIEFLRIQAGNAKKDYDRLEKTGDSIAAQDKEKQWLVWQQAKEEWNAADKQYQRLLAAQPLDVQLADARRTAAHAELERSLSTISLQSLDNQSAQAKARLRAARVTAPCNGTILRLSAHEGELVQGKPIVQMANLDTMIVVAEVPTSSIPRVQERDPATITSPVFKEELHGEVYSIGQIVGKPQVADADPLARVDYRIMEVKILLKQSKPADKYIGHEVNVSIHPRKQR